jgi:hypothetical protein
MAMNPIILTPPCSPDVLFAHSLYLSQRLLGSFSSYKYFMRPYKLIILALAASTSLSAPVGQGSNQGREPESGPIR